MPHRRGRIPRVEDSKECNRIKIEAGECLMEEEEEIYPVAGSV
jgi:hypothetical protein